MTLFNRDQLDRAFPGQPRLVAQMEELDELLADTESKAAAVSESLATVQNDIENEGRFQAKVPFLTQLLDQNSKAGAIELLGLDQVNVRPIDGADDASLMSRGVANKLYGGIVYAYAGDVPDDAFLVTVNASSGPVTVTLPEAASRTNGEINFKKIDSSGNDVTINGAGSETIDGAGSFTLSDQWDKVRLISNGADWFIS